MTHNNPQRQAPGAKCSHCPETITLKPVFYMTIYAVMITQRMVAYMC